MSTPRVPESTATNLGRLIANVIMLCVYGGIALSLAHSHGNPVGAAFFVIIAALHALNSEVVAIKRRM